MKKIIIFSVEGLISNTEINYYNGLSYHLNNVALNAFPIGKTKKSTNARSRTKNSVKNAILINNYDPDDLVTVFFIGDGDAREDIPAMKNSMEIASEFLEEFFDNITISKKLIMENSAFEAPFVKIGCKAINNSQKRGSNKSLFNNIALELNWFKNNLLDSNKMIKTYNEMKTKHVNIIMEIWDNEKNK